MSSVEIEAMAVDEAGNTLLSLYTAPLQGPGRVLGLFDTEGVLQWAIDSNMSELEFADEMGMQVVKLPETLKGDKGSNGKVKLIVKEVYEGRDFPNIAVSEALVFLNEFVVPYDIKEISHEDDKNTREALTRFDDSGYIYFGGDFTTGGLGLVYALPHHKLADP